MRINGITPDLEAATAHETTHFHNWPGDSWGVLCSHPKDCKIIGFSIDPVNNHQKYPASRVTVLPYLRLVAQPS